MAGPSSSNRILRRRYYIITHEFLAYLFNDFLMGFLITTIRSRRVLWPLCLCTHDNPNLIMTVLDARHLDNCTLICAFCAYRPSGERYGRPDSGRHKTYSFLATSQRRVFRQNRMQRKRRRRDNNNNTYNYLWGMFVFDRTFTGFGRFRYARNRFSRAITVVPFVLKKKNLK